MDAKIANTEPYAYQVSEGKKYAWCACGLSQEQPLCDGSHRGSGILPLLYTAERTETLYFCGCKQTAQAPLCDGTHNTLVKGGS